MNTPMLILTGTILFAISFGLGMWGMLLLFRTKGYLHDTHRLDQMEDDNLSVTCIGHRWALSRIVDGKPLMIGQSHETLRAAIDGAVGLVTNG